MCCICGSFLENEEKKIVWFPRYLCGNEICLIWIWRFFFRFVLVFSVFPILYFANNNPFRQFKVRWSQTSPTSFGNVATLTSPSHQRYHHTRTIFKIALSSIMVWNGLVLFYSKCCLLLL